MSEKITYLEPAERPLNVALSKAEVMALAKHHIAMTKRVSRHIGNRLTNLNGNSVFPKHRESTALIREGQNMVAAHAARAKGLLSILKQ